MPAESQPLLIATRSSGKLRELAEILSGLRVRTLSLEEAGIAARADEDAVECHDTFEANALAKARYFHDASGGIPTIADDSGLVVDALGGAPGVMSRRYSGRLDLGPRELDLANNARLLAELAALGLGAPAAARYVCAAAYVDEELELVQRGVIEGTIIREPRGEGGFGYDPYFESPELGGTFAEADWSQKARVSHRARAFGSLLAALHERGRTV